MRVSDRRYAIAATAASMAWWLMRSERSGITRINSYNPDTPDGFVDAGPSPQT